MPALISPTTKKEVLLYSKVEDDCSSSSGTSTKRTKQAKKSKKITQRSPSPRQQPERQEPSRSPQPSRMSLIMSFMGPGKTATPNPYEVPYIPNWPSSRGLGKVERTSSRNLLDGVGQGSKSALLSSKSLLLSKPSLLRAQGNMSLLILNSQEDIQLLPPVTPVLEETPTPHKPMKRRMSAPGNASSRDIMSSSKEQEVPTNAVLSRPIKFADFVLKTQKSCRLADRTTKGILKPSTSGKSKNKTSKRQRNQKCKAVSFSTNDTNDEVWCQVKEYHGFDPRFDSRDECWWTDDEFDARYEEDQEVETLIYERYAPLLRQAYKSIRDSQKRRGSLSSRSSHSSRSSKKGKEESLTREMVVVDMDMMAQCAIGRGLEDRVIPKIRDLIVCRHSKVVLATIRDARESACPASDIQKISLQYSRPSRLMALKMAEFDELQATAFF